MTEAQKLDRSLLVPSTKLPTYDVPIDTIHLYERNPRKNDKAVPIVRKSLEDFDQKVPIVVDAYGTIVAGHTRYKAMREMGWTTCTIVLADDLTPDQVKAYRIIDNRSSEYSTWDDVLLDLELEHMKKEDMRKLLQRILDADVPVDVIHENKPAANKDHPTMKPIRLIATLIQNSIRRGETVLDLFGGSGSTLMACEQLGRRCLTMELDPRYADVIIDRWETFTGQKAQKVGA